MTHRNRLAKVLALLVLVVGAVAAAPAASTVEFDVDGTLMLDVVAAQSGPLDIAVEVPPPDDGGLGGLQFAVYDDGDGAMVEAGVSYDFFEGHVERWDIDGQMQAGGSYLVVLEGSGTVELKDLVVGATRTDTEYPRGLVSVLTPWEPAPLSGGYILDGAVFEPIDDDAVVLSVFAAVREQAVAVNHTAGHMCVYGADIDCEETAVDLADTGLYPVTERLTVKSGVEQLDLSSPGPDLRWQLDVYRPGMQGVDEYAQILVVPGRFFAS